jgi:thiamine-monophosphate kinase
MTFQPGRNMGSEFGFIDWLRQRTPPADRVLIGPGDDCAALSPGRSPLLVTTDMLMDGTDFILAEVGPRRVGRKAMAVNLSDLAAMAARPLAAVVSVALPTIVVGTLRVPSPSRLQPPSRILEDSNPPDGTRSVPTTMAEELYLGLREMADAFGVPIVGGDTNSWAGPLVISVTAFGEADRPVRRNGARPGDWLFVTGPLGDSIAGHHLDFTPRVREALLLNDAVELHAMIDISDGLSADLHHVLEESHCGAVLVAEAIPRRDGASLANALGDGEDFELAFAVSPTDGEKLVRASPVPVWKVGECVETGYWIEEQETRRPLVPTGWEHRL